MTSNESSYINVLKAAVKEPELYYKNSIGLRHFDVVSFISGGYLSFIFSDAGRVKSLSVFSIDQNRTNV